jgi:hypothetical protein
MATFQMAFLKMRIRCQWMVTHTQLMGKFSLVILLGHKGGSMISMELVTMSMQILV